MFTIAFEYGNRAIAKIEETERINDTKVSIVGLYYIV